MSNWYHSVHELFSIDLDEVIEVRLDVRHPSLLIIRMKAEHVPAYSEHKFDTKEQASIEMLGIMNRLKEGNDERSG